MRASRLAVSSGIVAVAFTVLGCLALVANAPMDVIGATLAGLALAAGLFLGMEAATGAALVLALAALAVGGVAPGSGPGLSVVCFAVAVGAARICMDARRPALFSVSARRRLVAAPSAAAAFGLLVALVGGRVDGTGDWSGATRWLVPLAIIGLGSCMFVRPGDRIGPRRTLVLGVLGLGAMLALVAVSGSVQADPPGTAAPMSTAEETRQDTTPEGDRAENTTSTGDDPIEDLPEHIAAMIVVVLAMAVLALLSKTLFAEQPIEYEPSAPPGEGELTMMSSTVLHDEGEALAASEAAKVIADAAADLETIADPRLAIRAAYAALERGFEERELHRQPWESEREYLTRVRPALRAAPAAMERLTGVFERARFSATSIDETDRQAAIADLGALHENFRESAREPVSSPEGDRT